MPVPEWKETGGHWEEDHTWLTDEELAKCARAYDAEETGYAAEVQRLLGVDTITIPAHRRLDGSGIPYFGVRIFYRATIAGGALENERDGSTDEARWFREEEIADLNSLDIVRVGLDLDRTEPVTGSLRAP